MSRSELMRDREVFQVWEYHVQYPCVPAVQNPWVIKEQRPPEGLELREQERSDLEGSWENLSANTLEHVLLRERNRRNTKRMQGERERPERPIS